MRETRGGTRGERVAGEFDRQTLTGKGVVVAIIDTGIDWSHQDFVNPDGTSRRPSENFHAYSYLKGITSLPLLSVKPQRPLSFATFQDTKYLGQYRHL